MQTNAQRGRHGFEYELLDTGIFDDDRYFDVFVEFAKAAPEDLVVRIEAANRGPDAADLHVLPTLWFRNTWSWTEGAPHPEIRALDGGAFQACHPILGEMYLYGDAGATPLFTENETNFGRLFGYANRSPYVKDAFHRWLIQGETAAVNPELRGSKAAMAYQLEIPPGESRTIHLRLTRTPPQKTGAEGPLAFAMDALADRLEEADQFFGDLLGHLDSEDARRVMRQGLAGMMWTKQFYFYDVEQWLDQRGASPIQPKNGRAPRNDHWFHMLNADVLSMPDKWEYPWYAAWDLAFHVLPLALVDPDFAMDQMSLMFHERYLHPNGQIPAYEWNFGDVNPPVHAFSTLFIYQLISARTGRNEVKFLDSSFKKLLLNFTWWVNRKDPGGKNVFEGGFLGLDNIGVFDRSAPLPDGGRLEQADGTAWMAFFSQCMLRMALELVKHDASYEDMCIKFLEHFLYISASMDRPGDLQDEMWDEEDGFFYDVIRFPDGNAFRLKVRSVVGLLPLCAATVFEPGEYENLPRLAERVEWFGQNRSALFRHVHDLRQPGQGDRRMLSILDETKLRRVLARMLDPEEFLGDHGIRSLSRFHRDHPYALRYRDQDLAVAYLPGESDSGMFGGNSNWRGPIWMPINVLLVRALMNLHLFYGEEFRVECPTGSGQWMNLRQVAAELSRRLASLLLRDGQGERPVYGGTRKFQDDPHWRDLVLFYEYFHGDNGAGLGASHQTGWTGCVIPLMQMLPYLETDELGEKGAKGYFESYR